MADMREVAKEGRKETEQRKWYSRHGLDKNGRRKADSVYVVGEGEGEGGVEGRGDAKEQMRRVLAREKKHLRDMQRAMVEMEDLEVEDEVVVGGLEYGQEGAEVVVEEAEEEVEEAERALTETLAMEEVHKKEEEDAKLLGRFRIVHEKVRKQNTVVDIMLTQREETTKEQRWEKYVGKREKLGADNVKQIKISDLRRGLRKTQRKKKGGGYPVVDLKEIMES
ncbi:hypothetical protein TrRE_jg10782 [Triparma retinervis]|uniref:Uncharacterized protein n=1 Tax=Triparma retinervis TaxID=2557542 RepID=A0A9W6ZBN3_9STRA|nr:hypothetical protein TrRE_jg10782 [Triparma retinervis]